jgi:hypothetical protein
VGTLFWEHLAPRALLVVKTYVKTNKEKKSHDIRQISQGEKKKGMLFAF